MKINTRKVLAGIMSFSIMFSYIEWNPSNISMINTNLLNINATTILNISESGIQFIKNREGFSPYAYSDYSQNSIGYGCRCDTNQYPNGISETEADTLLRNTLKSYINGINDWANLNGVNLTQYQFDALVSFSFNVGLTSFKQSTLAKYIISGENAEAIAGQFSRWNKVTVNGEKVVHDGLVNRRKYEMNLYNYSDYAGSEVKSDNINPEIVSQLSAIKSDVDNFELVLQRNYSNVEYWGGDDDRYMVSDDGCALIGIMNLIKWNTGNTPNINELIDIAHNSGDRKWNQSGTASSFFKHYADQCGSQFGLSHVTTFSTSNTADIINYLNQGYDLIIHVSGHYIAAVDYDASNNKILILDGAPSNKRYTQSAKATWIPIDYFKGSIAKLSFTEISVTSFNQNQSITTKSNISDLLHGVTDGIKDLWNNIISGNNSSVTSRYNYPEPTRQLYLKSPMMTGEDIKWLQATLVEAGYNLTIDGYFGNKTKSAVISYQSNHGLDADGIVGPNTINSLKSTLTSNTQQVTESASEVTKYTEPTKNIGYTSPITTGEDVKWIQSNLNYLNHAGLSIDGQYGPLTRTAVKAFQASHGLIADGIVGPRTLAEMKACLNNEQGLYTPNSTPLENILSNGYPIPTRQLKNGSRGDDVKWLQIVLNKTINSNLTIDGTFGSKTKSAVINFQSTYSLNPDGIVGPNTLSKLQEVGSNIFVGAIAEPTISTIEFSNIDKTYYATSESIDFSFDTDTGNNFTLIIQDDTGNVILNSNTEDYKYSAYVEESGIYSAYVIASNESGSCTSETINFEIIDQNQIDSGAYIIKFSMFDSSLSYNNGSIGINSNEPSIGDLWRVEQDDDWTFNIINCETNKYLNNENNILTLTTYDEIGGLDTDSIPDSAKWYMFTENGHCFIKNKLSNQTLSADMNNNLSLEPLDMSSFSQEIFLTSVSPDTIVPTCKYLENGDVQISWNNIPTADSYNILAYNDLSIEAFLDLTIDTNSIVFTPPEGNFHYTIQCNNNDTLFVGSDFSLEDTKSNDIGEIGDISDDSQTLSQDLVDLMKLKKYILGISEFSQTQLDLMDMNLDNKVNLLDLIILKNWILSKK